MQAQTIKRDDNNRRIFLFSESKWQYLEIKNSSNAWRFNNAITERLKIHGKTMSVEQGRREDVEQLSQVLGCRQGRRGSSAWNSIKSFWSQNESATANQTIASGELTSFPEVCAIFKAPAPSSALLFASPLRTLEAMHVIKKFTISCHQQRVHNRNPEHSNE